MPLDEEKWNEIVRQWEQDEPGVSDVDTPPAAEAPTENVLPTMDLSAPTRMRPDKATDEQMSQRMPSAPSKEAPAAPAQPQSALRDQFAKAYGNAPAPRSDATDWTDLDQRLKAAQLAQGLSRGAESMFANIGAQSGYKPNQHAGDAGVDMVRGELDLAKAKQGQESHDVAMAKTKSEMGVKHAMDDPNSLQSQKAREAIKSFFGDTPPPSSLDSWSANDIQKFLKTGQLARLQDANSLSKQRTAEAARKATADTAAAASLDDERKLLISKYGFASDEVGRLDRKGLDHLWDRIGAGEKKKPPKPAKAPPAVAKPGDYSAVPSELRETVKAIVEGRAEAPSPGSRFGAQVLNYVTQVDPSFDASKFGSYKGVREKLSKSDEVVALNTAYNHVRRAKTNIPENFDTQSVNRIKQAIQTGAGADTLTPFETDVKIAADELAKAYGNNSEAGRATVEHLLEPNQSRAQLQARLAEVEELLGGKLGSYQHQFERVAPKGAQFQVVEPENAGGGEPSVLVVQKKSGKAKKMPKSKADALLSAPGGDAYEVR